MPEHRLSAASLDADLKAIERQGEDVVSITPIDGGDRFLVLTEYRDLETRS